MYTLADIVFHPLMTDACMRGFSIEHYKIQCDADDKDGITLYHPANYLTESEFESKLGQNFIDTVNGWCYNLSKGDKLKMQTQVDCAIDMVHSLEWEAEQKGLSLEGITAKNFNSFLDDLFMDGGETRCTHFVDYATDWAIEEGYPFESEDFDDVRWEIIEMALEVLEDRWS